MHAFDRRTDRRTDGRTDRIPIARPRLHSMQRGKNVRRVWLGRFRGKIMRKNLSRLLHTKVRYAAHAEGCVSQSVFRDRYTYICPSWDSILESNAPQPGPVCYSGPPCACANKRRAIVSCAEQINRHTEGRQNRQLVQLRFSDPSNKQLLFIAV